MTFHGSKVNRSEAVRWSTDIRYIRTRGTFSGSDEELAAEDFMAELLKRTAGTRRWWCGARALARRSTGGGRSPPALLCGGAEVQVGTV